ncbi:MAG: DUF1501 domain-containing protein [Candidatus Kapabacteria bacterium]|nr:DUF1501 domain-containing protein [Candidatus Kapabacteria bacterium]
MKRRDFIKTSLAASTLPIMINGMPVNLMSSPFNELMGFLGQENDRILVLINLVGGNDGLNTVIPIDRYDLLSKFRGQVIIPEKDVLKINDVVGLHPSLQGLKNLHDDAKLEIVQSVGYPNPNFSHFRSTDIWTSASDSDKVVTTGWLGRYLSEYHPDFPANYPNQDFTDPLSITIGGVVSETCQGHVASMGMALTPNGQFYDLNDIPYDSELDIRAGLELKYIKSIISQTNNYAETLKGALEKSTNLAEYPDAAQNQLSEQLKTVARLIAGGLKTKVYVVSLGGFDTHSDQVLSGNPLFGLHATLLQSVAEAVGAFQQDLKLHGLEDRVVGMTFSEFGRRILANASFGTDHGTSAPMFLFGSMVNPVIHGSNPYIPDEVTVRDNLDYQFDFRSVYYSLLMDWFEVPQDKLEKIMLGKFDYMQLIRSSSSVGESNLPQAHLSVYPNPVVNRAFINHTFDGTSAAKCSILDYTGRLLFESNINIINGNAIELDLSQFPSGTYIVKISNGKKFGTIKLMKI